ncbi:MAG: response regulator [Pirellulales bacterium]|nr:response regulator [Pirellulales bacterium]
MRILIVDDDEIAIEMLSHALQLAGYEVQSATNGHDALELVRQGDCRLVITDWEMPRLTGIELCEALRAEDCGGYIYIILLTSRCGSDEIVAGLSAGADDFIAKPFDPAELVARVRAGERVLSLETREVAIFAMAKLAESRDPETGAHLERVRSYSRVLAQQLATQSKFRGQIDAEFIRLIYLTSPLHDIGKVGIPDSVLLKPGRLSDAEFEIMKTHAAIGEATLDAARERFPEAKFLTMARDIAAAHHERWDGQGYPRKLVAEQIPLAARIVALADVYDALTSRRVYKQAFQHHISRAIVIDESGSHFDPDVVEAFLARETDFIAIAERYGQGAAVGLEGAACN